MRARSSFPLFALLALFALALPACDSGTTDPDPDELTAAYFVGSWGLTGASDSSGDRTAEVDAALDALTTTFAAGGTFDMNVNYSAAINGAGVPDAVVFGNYALSTSDNLVLTLPATDTTPAIAVPLAAVRVSASQFTLSTTAAVVNQLISGTGVSLNGIVTLTLTKQG